MKYSYDSENITIYYTNPIIVDIEQHIRILNHSKRFKSDDHTYPSYTYNKKKVSILEYLFSCPEECLEPRNENKYDLRESNIRCKGYPEAIFVYTKKHSMWKIHDDHYVMICGNNLYVDLDSSSFDKIRDMDTTFLVNKEGFIKSKEGYLHEILLGMKNVEYIDQNPLNNRMSNLRVQKKTKRARKKTAIELPVGITQDMLNTYVVYYKECYNREKQLFREFFKIEKHPMLNKPWCTSKSNKIHIMDKLKQANEKVEQLMY